MSSKKFEKKFSILNLPYTIGICPKIAQILAFENLYTPLTLGLKSMRTSGPRKKRITLYGNTRKFTTQMRCANSHSGQRNFSRILALVRCTRESPLTAPPPPKTTWWTRRQSLSKDRWREWYWRRDWETEGRSGQDQEWSAQCGNKSSEPVPKCTVWKEVQWTSPSSLVRIYNGGSKLVLKCKMWKYYQSFVCCCDIFIVFSKTQ